MLLLCFFFVFFVKALVRFGFDIKEIKKGKTRDSCNNEDKNQVFECRKSGVFICCQRKLMISYSYFMGGFFF